MWVVECAVSSALKVLFSSYHAKQQAVVHHSSDQQTLGSYYNTLQTRSCILHHSSDYTYAANNLRLHLLVFSQETSPLLGTLSHIIFCNHFNFLRLYMFCKFHILPFFVLFYHAHISFILPLFCHSIAKLYWKNSAGPWQPFLCTTYSHYLPLVQSHIICYWKSAFLLSPCLF